MRKQTRAITYNTYKEHEQEIMSGTVERLWQPLHLCQPGSMKPNCQTRPNPLEKSFSSHDRIEVYVYKVEDNPRGVKRLC
mgnify:CR=1 FL=1